MKTAGRAAHQITSSRRRGDGDESARRLRRLLGAVIDHAYHVRVEKGRAAAVVHDTTCAALTGYGRRELAADPALWDAIVPVPDRARVAKQTARVLAGRDAPPVEHRIRRKNGRTRWIRRTLVPQRDARGRLVAFDGLVRDITGTVGALRASEERYRNLFESDLTGDFLARPDGTLVLCNRAFLEMFGFAGLHEAAGTKIDALLADAGAWQAAVRSLTQKRDRLHRQKLAARRRDGTPLHVVECLVGTFDDRGELVELQGYFFDNTEYVEVEAALRESEGRLQLFIEHAPVALAMLDREMRYLALSRRWMEDYLGGVGDFRGRCHYDVFPQCPDRWRAAHRRGLDGEVVRVDEDAWERPDGSVRWARYEVRPWRTNDGAVGGIVIFTEDIGDRKRAEQLLRRLNETLERRVAAQTEEIRVLAEAVANLEEGVLITADELDWPGSRILFVNDAMCRMSGYRRDELTGATPRLLRGAGREGDPTRRIKSSLSAGRGVLVELTNARKDGSPYEVEVSITPLFDAGGRRTNFVAIYRDVSQRRETENRLRRRETELAHTQRLHALGELAAGLAHEMAQPLAAIANEVGACVRFVQTGRGERGRLLASLDRAAHEAQHAGEVLQHMRQLVEKRPVDFQVVDLRDVAAAAVDLVRHTADRRGVRLRLDVGRRALPVSADRVQIEQVIVNLLQNAVDAIDAANRERRQVEVVCRQNARNAEVAVRDSGPGLTRAQRARLFEPFFTTKAQGLGMGMPISRRIVEGHGGSIAADRPGAEGGTTIRFTLPLRSRRPRAKRSSR